MRRPGTAVISLAVAVLAGGGVLGGQLAARATVTGAAVPPPEKILQQQLEWRGCGDFIEGQAVQAMDAAGTECAQVTVPVDYAKPDGPTLKVAISRIKAKDEQARRGVLLSNPGGPGGLGLPMPAILSALAPDVAARYDLIGMDPRFVGASTPLDCEWPVSSSMRGAGPDKRSFAKHVTFSKRLAGLCADVKGVLPHVSTRNTARDMDVIRALLGEEKMSYLGYSYGTYLGSVYLQMFPGRVDRIVLDSAVDPTAFGPNLFARSGPAMNAALKAWAGWTARRNGTYRLGTTSKQVLANVELIRKTADKRPLKVGDYRIDAGLIPMLMWVADDDPEVYAEQASVVSILRDAARGAPVDPTVALAEALDYIVSREGSAMASVQTSILCADRAVSRNTGTYFKDIQKHRKAEPLFGPLTRNLGPCSFWPAKPAENPTRVSSAVPALILNSTGDTQTPYAGAKVLHKLLSKSRMVTLRNAYRHGVYLTGRSNCADRTVQRYLLDGVLPARDVTCATDRAATPPSGLSGFDRFDDLLPSPGSTTTPDRPSPWAFMP